MKKTYMSPITDIVALDATEQLLVSSDPTFMGGGSGTADIKLRELEELNDLFSGL